MTSPTNTLGKVYRVIVFETEILYEGGMYNERFFTSERDALNYAQDEMYKINRNDTGGVVEMETYDLKSKQSVQLDLILKPKV